MDLKNNQDSNDLQSKNKKFVIEIRKKKKQEFFKRNRKMYYERANKFNQDNPESSNENKSDMNIENEYSSTDQKIGMQIRICLEFIDEAYKKKKLDNVSKYLHQLRLIISSSKNPDEFPAKEVYNSGAYLVIIAFLNKENNMGNKDIISECLWLISNMMLVKKEYLEEFLKEDLLLKMSKYLDLKHDTHIKSIFWGLANLLAEMPSQIHNVIRFEFLDFLLSNSEFILEIPSIEKTIAWFISNLFRKEINLNPTLQMNLMDRYYELINGDMQDETTMEMVTAVKDFLDLKGKRFNDKIELIISKDPMELLVELGYCKNSYIRTIALQILGRISYAEQPLSDYLIKEEIKEMLVFIICSQNKDYTEESKENAIWIISNLVTDSHENCMFFSTRELLYKIVENISSNLSGYKEGRSDDDFIDKKGFELINSQFNNFYLLKNFYVNFNEKEHRNRFVKDLNLIDLLLESLEMENIKVIGYIIDFLENILSSAMKDFSQK
jgi:hypothetical protein